MLLLLLSEGRPKANSVMQTDFNNSRVFQGGMWTEVLLFPDFTYSETDSDTAV